MAKIYYGKVYRKKEKYIMKIGIDIDGVLNSHYDFCLTYGSKYCNEIGKYQIEDINAFDTTDMFK